jgi:hypothetical protein
MHQASVADRVLNERKHQVSVADRVLDGWTLAPTEEKEWKKKLRRQQNNPCIK